VDKARTSEPPSPSASGSIIDLINAIRILRAVGGALFAQAVLYGQLARVDWAEEKGRLVKMLVITLLGFACLLCVMLFVGALVLAFSWETAYRIPAVMALIAVYGIGTSIAWRRLQALAALGDQAFAATREELAADIALIRGKL
jgi:uncharacterized membrane protein YqjE